MRRLTAEFVGTFVLVFAGTGAIVINDGRDGMITHVGVSLVFGLVVLALIYALGDVSGAHLNPAVTLSFSMAGRFPLRDVPFYIIAQCGGAIFASTALRVLFPEHGSLGATLPYGPAWRSFVLEIFLTAFLMLVVLQVSTGSKEKGLLAGVAVGSVIALEALFAGPICGASMNPARSLAPALIAGRPEYLWLYLLAPIVGGALAVPLWHLLRPEESLTNV